MVQRPPERGPVSALMRLAAPPGFDLARAVCSYGYFILAPNRWEPGEQALHRPLRGTDGRVYQTRSDQPLPGAPVRVRVEPAPGPADREALKGQLSRMFRLDEDPAVFARWAALHPQAAAVGFGRIFRSPSVFEDIVKTMTGCNVTWPSTMRMNRLLCDHVGQGAFPTPEQLAAVRVDVLKRRCKVGYRAGRIVRLAREVASGRLDLAGLEDPALSTDDLVAALRRIHGIGPYAAANLCQLLGRYDRLPIDTETYRHFRQELDTPTPDAPARLHPAIEAHFAPYAPFQFLAYWFDLWRSYERRQGDARQWLAHVHGTTFTATKLTPLPPTATPTPMPAPTPGPAKKRGLKGR